MADSGDTSVPAGQAAGTGFGWLGAASRTIRRGEIALALGLVCVLTVLILPMPPWMLDMSSRAASTPIVASAFPWLGSQSQARRVTAPS